MYVCVYYIYIYHIVEILSILKTKRQSSRSLVFSTLYLVYRRRRRPSVVYRPSCVRRRRPSSSSVRPPSVVVVRRRQSSSVVAQFRETYDEARTSALWGHMVW